MEGLSPDGLPARRCAEQGEILRTFVRILDGQVSRLITFCKVVVQVVGGGVSSVETDLMLFFLTIPPFFLVNVSYFKNTFNCGRTCTPQVHADPKYTNSEDYHTVKI